VRGIICIGLLSRLGLGLGEIDRLLEFRVLEEVEGLKANRDGWMDVVCTHYTMR
jgi:hypothetical protein